MWNLAIKWYEIIFRAFIVFMFIFIGFRFWGKKHLSQLAPFDLVILLIISEAVQSALIGDDKGIPAALISVTTLFILVSFLNKLSSKSQNVEKILEGSPKVIIQDGVVNKELMIKETITERELQEALRMQGILKIDDVFLGTLETNGALSVIKKRDLEEN